MRPLSRPLRITLISVAVVIYAVTWLYLVLNQPEDSDFSSMADSASTTIALVGFLVPTIIALVVVIPTLPVRTLALMPVALVLNIVVGQVVG
ncbi:MAG: ECF transporter S component, partial [Corynebacterium sp.]|nr:ECF transporter S component [Corynebacterium sp.]